MPEALVPSSRVPVAKEDGTFSREWYLYFDKLAEKVNPTEAEKTYEALNLQHLKEMLAFKRITIN